MFSQPSLDSTVWFARQSLVRNQYSNEASKTLQQFVAASALINKQIGIQSSQPEQVTSASPSPSVSNEDAGAAGKGGDSTEKRVTQFVRERNRSLWSATNERYQLMYQFAVRDWRMRETWERHEKLKENLQEEAEAICHWHIRSGYDRRRGVVDAESVGVDGSSFTVASKGVFFHIWQNRHEGKRFHDGLRRLAEACWRLSAAVVLHAPLSTLVRHQGLLVSVCWMPPLSSSSPLQVESLDNGLSLQTALIAEYLRLSGSNADLAIYRADDCRCYVIDIDRVMSHPIAPRCVSDSSREVRLAVLRYQFEDESRNPKQLLKDMMDKSIEQLVQAYNAADPDKAQFDGILTNRVIPDILHGQGLGLSFIGSLLLSPQLSCETEEKTLFLQQSLIIEMVTRSCKSLLEAIFRAVQTGESISPEVSIMQRVLVANNFLEKLSTSRAFLREHVLPIMMEKFNLPADYVLATTTVHLPAVINAVRRDLGLEMDAGKKQMTRFFPPKVIRTSLFSKTPLLALIEDARPDETAAYFQRRWRMLAELPQPRYMNRKMTEQLVLIKDVHFLKTMNLNMCYEDLVDELVSLKSKDERREDNPFRVLHVRAALLAWVLAQYSVTIDRIEDYTTKFVRYLKVRELNLPPDAPTDEEATLERLGSFVSLSSITSASTPKSAKPLMFTSSFIRRTPKVAGQVQTPSAVMLSQSESEFTNASFAENLNLSGGGESSPLNTKAKSLRRRDTRNALKSPDQGSQQSDPALLSENAESIPIVDEQPGEDDEEETDEKILVSPPRAAQAAFQRKSVTFDLNSAETERVKGRLGLPTVTTEVAMQESAKTLIVAEYLRRMANFLAATKAEHLADPLYDQTIALYRGQHQVGSIFNAPMYYDLVLHAAMCTMRLRGPYQSALLRGGPLVEASYPPESFDRMSGLGHVTATRLAQTVAVLSLLCKKGMVASAHMKQEDLEPLEAAAVHLAQGTKELFGTAAFLNTNACYYLLFYALRYRQVPVVSESFFRFETVLTTANEAEFGQQQEELLHSDNMVALFAELLNALLAENHWDIGLVILNCAQSRYDAYDVERSSETAGKIALEEPLRRLQKADWAARIILHYYYRGARNAWNARIAAQEALGRIKIHYQHWISFRKFVQDLECEGRFDFERTQVEGLEALFRVHLEYCAKMEQGQIYESYALSWKRTTVMEDYPRALETRFFQWEHLNRYCLVSQHVDKRAAFTDVLHIAYRRRVEAQEEAAFGKMLSKVEEANRRTVWLQEQVGRREVYMVAAGLTMQRTLQLAMMERVVPVLSVFYFREQQEIREEIKQEYAAGLEELRAKETLFRLAKLQREREYLEQKGKSDKNKKLRKVLSMGKLKALAEGEPEDGGDGNDETGAAPGKEPQPEDSEGGANDAGAEAKSPARDEKKLEDRLKKILAKSMPGPKAPVSVHRRIGGGRGNPDSNVGGNPEGGGGGGGGGGGEGQKPQNNGLSRSQGSQGDDDEGMLGVIRTLWLSTKHLDSKDPANRPPRMLKSLDQPQRERSATVPLRNNNASSTGPAHTDPVEKHLKGRTPEKKKSLPSLPQPKAKK